jgi:hypothetical protein
MQYLQGRISTFFGIFSRRALSGYDGLLLPKMREYAGADATLLKSKQKRNFNFIFTGKEL